MGAAQCNGDSNVGDTFRAESTITVQVTGLPSLPSGAGAVVLNVTAVHPGAQTHLTVYPGPGRPGGLRP